jgi:predicted nucleotidyltransferase
MQVKSLYLFGSGARENDYVSESDIDFLYTMITDREAYL